MMPEYLLISILCGYFFVIMCIAWYTSRNTDTHSFFTANKSSPWYLVAFGMIGASLSGVTFISVPGNVVKVQFGYFQMVLGYVLGYVVIAELLMPLYYRLNLVSIYTYLEQRFGRITYRWGAFFFLLSRTLGSALRLFLAANVLQIFLFHRWNVPFIVTVAITIGLIWLYTFRGGIKTIVWTDTFQTFFLISSVVLSVYLISSRLGLGFTDMLEAIYNSRYSKIFFWEDMNSRLFFPKMFFGGMFIAIAMTGLDQDLMQKNLTCRNIKEAKLNMYSFTGVLVVVNLFFLSLGALLYIYCEQRGIEVPKRTDDMFPMLAMGELGLSAGVFFILGITASSYASADSALAALTTSFCIDFLDFKNKTEQVRRRQKTYVHVGFSFVFLLVILIFYYINHRAIIDVVLDLAGFTYGPLVALFALGMFTKRKLNEKWVPWVCIVCPLLSVLIYYGSSFLLNGFEFGSSIIILNSALCSLGFWWASK
ncbi:MAG: sodium:solute symporter [Cytophagaceae bacterium]|nr:sodium:solute symporter [Cytophagaceae bacterium]MDW8457151.1 sodium:solute symporter [Cytophagaceae bacterium]